MESEAHDGALAPEAPAEQTEQVDAAADSMEVDSMQAIDIDPLATSPSAEADAISPDPASSPPLPEHEAADPADQVPEETTPPPVPEAPAVKEASLDEIEPSEPAPEAPVPADPVPAVESTVNAVAPEPVATPQPVPSQSAVEPIDLALEAPRPVSDMGAEAGTSQGATTSAVSNVHYGPTLGGLNGAAPQPASASEPTYRDIQVVPSEHSGVYHCSICPSCRILLCCLCCTRNSSQPCSFLKNLKHASVINLLSYVGRCASLLLRCEAARRQAPIR